MTVSDPIAVAEQVLVSEHQLHEKIINEEFKIWKKTVPLLYDTIHSLALNYPLLSADFFPSYTISDNKNQLTAKLAVGTNTSGKDQDHVHIVDVTLPSTLAPDFADFAIGENLPIPASASENALKISRLWKHPGEVNRVRVSPDGTKLITFDNKGVIHLYEEQSESCKNYSFHTAEGYCLEWVSDLQFLSGANDNQIGLWDLATTSGPTKKFTTHSAVINDVSYSRPSKVLFGSVSDDFTTQIHDLRAPEESPAIKISEKFIQNAIQFHPDIASLFSTAGKDNVVTLYDARNTREPLRKFFAHNDSVLGLKWGGSAEPDYLYSWGLDKRVLSWDLNQLGEEFVPPVIDVTDSRRRLKYTSDPCLHFIHGGHTRRINDLALHPTIPSLFASVGDDCLLQLYKPKVVLEHSEDLDDSDEKGDESDKEKSKDDNEDTDDQGRDDQDMEVDHDNDEGTAKEDDDDTGYDLTDTKDQEEDDQGDSKDVDMESEGTPAP